MVKHKDGTRSDDGDLELMVHRHLGGTDTIAALPPGVFKQLVEQVRDNPAFEAYAADTDADISAGPSADTSRSNPMPAPLRYGKLENDYVAITLEGGAVAIRDGNDPTGKVHQYPIQQWRALMSAIRGEDDPQQQRQEWETPSTGDRRSNPTGDQLHERTQAFAAADEKATPDKKAGRK